MHKCKDMNYYLSFEKEKIVLYNEIFDEYGIPECTGGTSYIIIKYCPWCGGRLPDSKRNEWFEELETLGFDDPFSDEIPSKFRSAEWYLGKPGKSLL